MKKRNETRADAQDFLLHLRTNAPRGKFTRLQVTNICKDFSVDSLGINRCVSCGILLQRGHTWTYQWNAEYLIDDAMVDLYLSAKSTPRPLKPKTTPVPQPPTTPEPTQQMLFNDSIPVEFVDGCAALAKNYGMKGQLLIARVLTIC